ncbi:uncharacterized protein LOC120473233 [Pimephales promelas]|uniref:uncharacterized protein LOC120473233 n=1 Tax=Pimephales promelas TaxID=90988 RepID=UPI00195588A0|nr:uncharacterized protein LOC120473233 [Pimephales promelas]KAG1931241.1 hypothetical protein F2P79_021753 [Pimephales promelas]
MANCGESQVAISNSTWSPEFIQELLPSAQRTALLYNLSFLCLGGFPKLERLIREQAIDTQMLFGSSEALLLKCVGTSSNLVTSLFPMLISAVEKNKPVLAVKYLEKARAWINDIIKAVEAIVTRYDQQTRSVKTCTSDVFQEQKDTEDKITKQTDEMKGLENALADLETELRNTCRNMEEIDRRYRDKNQELQNNIRHYEKNKQCSWFLRAFVPFFAVHQDCSNLPGIAAKQAELAHIDSEKNGLRNTEWNIKVQQTDLQLKLANSKIKLGAIPNPVHLKEVQRCLDQIRQILVDLKKFWEKVGVMLDTLKEKTFVGEDLIEMCEMKDEFISSIEEAGKYWKRFGDCCQRAQGIFSVQSKDAYKFLEINPSSLSEDERKALYKSIMERLKKIDPHGSSQTAINK